MNLEGEWSVALTSIVYPQNWYTLAEEDSSIHVIWHDPELDGKISDDFYRQDAGRITLSPKTLTLSPGHYQSIEALVDELKTTIAQGIDLNKRGFRIIYDRHSRKLTVGVKKGAELELSANLSALLGYTRTARFVYTPVPPPTGDRSLRYVETLFQDHTGDRVIDMENGFYNIYVYLDILEAQPVGDVMVPLLKVIPLVHRDKDLVYHEFEHLSHIPVGKKNFDQIGVQLARDDGEPVPFESGNVVLTLEFKKNVDPLFL